MTDPTSIPAGVDPHPAEETPGASLTSRLSLGGRSVRQHAARGTLVNGSYTVALSGISLLKGLLVAVFVSRADYGVYGILAISLTTLLWLKQVGIGDKFIQQSEDDQELAFQKAFTLELLFVGAWVVLFAAVLPLLAIFYGEHRLLLPGFALLLTLPAGALQSPLWIHNRKMDFVRQRLIQGVDPVVGFAVTVGLAAAGAGYWAIIAGLVAGAWATALIAIATSPFALRLRYDRGTLRSYASFSWPLFVAGAAGLVIAQSAVISTQVKLGLAGVGVITLAANISQFTDRVDGIVTGTLYPAICAVQDRTALLHESFVKSNRLALVWAMPFGLGLSLFAGDLVHFVIGDHWRPAVVVLQVYGVVAALGHVGFNWDVYFRARADTRPLAIAAGVTALAFVATGPALLFAYGLPGLAAGVAVQAVVNLLARSWFLARLFRGFTLARHAVRAIAPALPGVALVLLVRLAEPDGRTALTAAGELAAFAAVTAGMTILLEGSLLREAVGYLRSQSAAVPQPAAVSSA